MTRHDMEISGDDMEMPNTFVPARNMLFLSFASALAYQTDAKTIITGVCETDFSGYPDCRDIFIKSRNVTANLAMDKDFVNETTLLRLDEKETRGHDTRYDKVDTIR